MKYLIAALIVALSTASSSEAMTMNQLRAYLNAAGLDADRAEAYGALGIAPAAPGHVQITSWLLDVPRPDAADLVPEAEADAAETAAMEAKAAARVLEAQESKPLERKHFENAFYELVGQLLVATSDPRATDPAIPKLGFLELQALIEVLQTTDPMAAINLSLKLLTLDSALKRYDMLWWDSAAQHVITE